MKTLRNITFAIFVLSSFVSIGQGEVLAERLGAHKEWNVAFVRDLRIDSVLTLNAILIQTYSDSGWDALLATMGKSSEQLCSGNYSGNIVFWFADKNTLMETSFKMRKDDDCFVFAQCSERTFAIFFPHNQSDRDRILSLYLSKGQIELHKFSQRNRNK